MKPESYKQKYRTDPEFRAQQLQRRHEYHEKNKNSQNYLATIQIRKKIYNTEESIEFHRAKIKTLQKRLRYQMYRKEELELAWGKERAERKRAQRSVAEPRSVADPRKVDEFESPNARTCES